MIDISPATKRRLLGKSVAPSSLSGLNAIGARILPRDDVVLTKLAMSDEREYQKMFDTCVAVSSAVEQRINGLLEMGSEVVEGNSGSAAAVRNKDFAIRLLQGIPQWPTLLREMSMAHFYGWRPIALEWGELVFEGGPHLGIARAEAQWPWEYEFTVDRMLVRKPTGVGDGQVFDGPDAPYQWLICSSGSTKTPYGVSKLKRLWMLYFLIKNFERMSAQAMQRSLGLVKVKWEGAPTFGDAGGANESQLESAIGDMLDKLTANNVLMETQEYSLELVKNSEFSGSYREMMEHFNKEMRIGIVGQNLTSEVKGGSLAAARVHQDTLESFWSADARELGGWINDGLLKPAITLNFGEQDSDDLPKWRSTIFSKPDVEGVKMFLDYGGKVDGKRLGATFNVPVFAEDEDADVVLEKQAQTNPFSTLAPPPDKTDKGAAARAAAADADIVDSEVDQALAAAVSMISPSAADYFGHWSEKLLDRNDPKALPPSS